MLIMSSQSIFIPRSSLPSSGVKWAKKARLIASFFLLCISVSVLGVKNPSTMRILYPLKIEKDCTTLGFPGYKLNSCGHCVGETSELDNDYGKDCAGNCHGNAKLDCNNVCNGKSYVDECTGKCVDSAAATEKSRNCLGMCLSGQTLPYPDDYTLDGCGICTLGSEPDLEFSEFKDCAQQCHLPGNLEKQGSELVCGECVNRHDNNSAVHNLTCPNNPYRIVCNGVIDICGECGGHSNSCFAIRNVHPNAIPSTGKNITVTLKGAFKGVKVNISCAFEQVPESKTIFVPSRQVDDNGMTCNVTLKTGTYKVGARMVNDSEETIKFAADNETLNVFFNNAKYTSMTPRRVPYKGFFNTETFVDVKFKGANTNEYPLICIVEGKHLPRHKGYSRAVDPLKRPHTCRIPLQLFSQTVKIIPTYDGLLTKESKMKDGFNLTFFAPPPSPNISFIAHDGSTISIAFDRPINLCNIGSRCKCEHLLEQETLDNLDSEIVCRWATKQQLMITLKNPYKGDSITMRFIPGALREDMQIEAIAATENLAVVARRLHTAHPLVVGIAGPDRIPNCGQFSLFGHHTSPVGGVPSYRWSALRADGLKLSDPLYRSLQAVSSVVLPLSAEWLDTDVNYTFTFTVQPTEGPARSGYHIIEKMPYPGAFIVAYSNTFLDLLPHKPSRELGLFWEMSVPECLGTGNRALGYWTASDPRVKIDFNKFMSSIYRAPANSLPEDSTIVFTANAFLGNSSKDLTSSKVTVRVGSSNFMAKIKGTASRRVGDFMHINSSIVTLQGTVYGDYGGTMLRYRWSCVNESGYPCYSNMQTNGTNAYLISESQRYQSEISFLSRQVKQGQNLNFTFEVFNASNPANVSRDSTIVQVLPGKLPQVVIEEVTCRGVPVSEKSASGAYLIPAGASVMVEGSVLATPSRRFRRWAWNVTGATEAFLIAYTNNKTYFFLREGATVGHGVYNVKLKVCNGKGIICNEDNISMYAVPGVTNCKLVVGNYTVLDFVQAQVTDCSVPFQRAPLMYQLYMLSDKGYKVPISGPQFGNTIPFTGPAPILYKIDMKSHNGTNVTIIEEDDDDSAEFSNIKFTVEVCDRLFVCNFFDEVEAEVSRVVNKTQSTINLLQKAQNEASAGDVITALALLSVAAKSGNITMVQYDLLEYIKLAISIVPLGSGQVALIYAALKPLLKVKNLEIQKKSLAAITAATTKAASLKMTPSLSAIEVAYTLTSGVVCRNPYSEELLSAASETEESLIKTLVMSTKLAEKIILRSPDSAIEKSSILFIHHTYLNTEPYHVIINETERKPVADVTLKFSSKLIETVSRSNCGSGPCEQIVLALTLYPGHSLHPDGTTGTRMSSTISVKLFSPVTGKEIKFNEKDCLDLSMLQTSNQTGKNSGNVSRCHMWDGKFWSMEDVSTLGSSDGRIQCIASRSGMYTVLEVKHGLSGGAIAGIIVATMMFVGIMGMVVLFFLRQKREAREAKKAAKASNQELKNDMSEEEFPPTP